MPKTGFLIKTIKAHSFLFVPLMIAVAASGCASNLSGYYSELSRITDCGDYEQAANFAAKSKKKYGKKNILLYYLDSGILNHFAGRYEKSTENFEEAKKKFDDYYQKSITAGAASFVFNDNTKPYYGSNFERAHINIFEALNYIALSEKDEAAVEARQINSLFNAFASDKSYKSFYGDDGFIRYFMGLVYENAGYLNDAHVSYYLALRAYKNGIADIAPPKDLINDAYTTALLLKFDDRAQEIKNEFPDAQKTVAPGGYGELIIIDYNGIIPEKVDNIVEYTVYSLWPYINQVEVSGKEAEEFDRARSISISLFADDYIKIAFPKYRRNPNAVKTFTVVRQKGKNKTAYKAQDLADIAEKCLQDDISKIYAKTLARAVVKYIIAKSVRKAVEDITENEAWGVFTQIGFNIFNSLTASSDKRSWRTLPENILMSRLYLPAGTNVITVNYIGARGEILFSQDLTVDIESGKKTFKILRSFM